MTRLAEWLAGIVLFLSTWYTLILKRGTFPPPYDFHILLIPVYVVLCFGLYSAMVVLYRVYTFNDCSDAAEELKKEIKTAREDLEKKGFIFD